MNKTTLIAGAVALASFAGAASAVTIDFDKAADGSAIASRTLITDQYASLGVTFDLIEDGESIGAPLAFGDKQTNRLLNLNELKAGTAANRADIIRVSFTTPVWGLYVEHSDNVAGGSLKAYDADGLLLQEITGKVGNNAYQFIASGIARLDILQGAEDKPMAFDNLSFTAAVPLPATALLLPVALGALGFAGRRKRA